jgi:predicted nucleic acid-binding protein
MSKLFVLDEWLLHDLGGQNGFPRQQETLKLLLQLKKICDRIVIPQSSPWAAKAYELMKSNDVSIRRCSKYLQVNIVQDNMKATPLHPDDLQPLPTGLQGVIPRKDEYLVQSYLAARAEALVTTDEGLLQAASSISSPRIVARRRDEFVREYLCREDDRLQRK